MIESTSQDRKQTTTNQYENNTHLIFPKDNIVIGADPEMNQLLKILENDFKIPFTNMLRNLEMTNQAIQWGTSIEFENYFKKIFFQIYKKKCQFYSIYFREQRRKRHSHIYFMKLVYIHAQSPSHVWLLRHYGLWPTSVHGILQARILEWIAISSSRGYSWPREQTWVSCISWLVRHTLYHWATWEALWNQNKLTKTLKERKKKAK